MSKLHAVDTSQRTKAVLIAAEAVGIALPLQKPQQPFTLNPYGLTPHLETPEGSIFGWVAVLRHLARTTGKLYGSTAFEASKVDEYLDNISLSLADSTCFVARVVSGKATPTKKEWEYHCENIEQFFKVLETNLKGSFVVGSLSIADIGHVALLAGFWENLADEAWKKAHPASTAYLSGLEKLPEVSKHVTYTENKKLFVPKFEEKKAEKKEDKKEEKGKKEEDKKEEKGKKEDKKKEEKKEAKKDQKKETKKEDKKDKKKKKDEEEEEEEDEAVAAEKKKKNPLDELPKSTFNMDDFKREYVNAPLDDRAKVLHEHFWSKFDRDGWSIWKVYYQKYEGEGEKVYLTSNLKNGFLQRLDSFRKYSFAVHGVYGDEPSLEIRGVWFWRGVGIPEDFKEHPSYEYHTITQLSPDNENDRKVLEEYWLNLTEGLKVEGLTVQDAKYFK